MNDIKTNNNKEVVIIFTKKTIALFIFALAALLAFIGVFGTMLKVSQTNGTISIEGQMYGLKYIFKEIWDEIQQLSDAGAPSGMIGLYRFEAILLIVSFVFAVGVAAYCIGSTVYSIVNKKEFNLHKRFALFIVSLLQYPLFMKIVTFIYQRNYNAGQTTLTETNFAWGAILIFVSFFIGLIGLLVIESKNKESFLSQSNIVLKVSLFFIFFLFVFAIASSAGMQVTSQNSKITTNYSALSWRLALFALIQDGTEGVGAIKATATVAFILQILAVVFLSICAYLALNNSKNNGKKLIIFSIIFLLCAIFSGVLQNISTSEYISLSKSTSVVAKLSSGTIVGIILGSLLVIGLIVSSLLNGKKLKFVK